MKDVFAFVADLPWWVWLFAVVWYFAVCIRRERQKLNVMTPDEREEYQVKLRRKNLGLD